MPQRPLRVPLRWLAAAAALILAACWPWDEIDSDQRLHFFAASSTVEAVEAAINAYDPSLPVLGLATNFGPSSTLARQIVSGARADLFLAASVEWADYVSERVEVRRRQVVAGNRLVVVGPEGPPLSDAEGTDIAVLADPVYRRIAVADTEAVPAGVYAREALIRNGLWSTLRPRLVPTVDVRAALAAAERGEVEAAIVYASDALISARVRTIVEVDPATHEPIRYVLLLLTEDLRAVALYDFLISETGLKSMRAYGLTPPPPLAGGAGRRGAANAAAAAAR